MTLYRRFLLTSLTALAALLAAGCGASKKDDPAAASPAAGGLAVAIQAGVASRTDLSVIRTYAGTLEGEEQANVVSKISERITAIRASVGAQVRANQVVVALEKSGASSQYFQAEANSKNAEKTLQRMRSLFEEGAIAAQALDGAQTAFDVARANFEAARSTVELATPIAGIVTAVNASVGDLTTPGSVLMTVARINRMKVIFNMNEADIVNLAPGQTVSIYSEARPDQAIEGRIVQLSRSADIGSRSFEVKALFPNNRDGWFKPGMFCRVRVPLSSRKNTLAVPTAAVQSDGSASRVFVIHNGQAFQRSVQTGVATDQRTEILEGVAQNDTVATVGINNLKDSTAVTVVSLQ